jgi:TnpA family transposase
VRYIDTELIIQNWDDIMRLIATIKLKEVTASDLFRRLNSYSQQHALYRALKAFGKIIKSIFILRFIDDVALRQASERQLNKIEHAHRFARAVSVGNPREFIEAEKQEQEIAEGCKRLIKNELVASYENLIEFSYCSRLYENPFFCHGTTPSNKRTARNSTQARLQRHSRPIE